MKKTYDGLLAWQLLRVSAHGTSKETLIHEKRPTKETHECEGDVCIAKCKRDIYTQNETYGYGKKHVLVCERGGFWESACGTSKETSIHEKRR